MKKRMCMILAVILLLASAACGKQAEPEIREWTRQGYFTDENQNILTVTWMEDVVDPGWYVGCMLGEDLMEDSWGGILPQEGNTLRGKLPSSGSRGELTVTVSEEGENGLALAVDGGETYHFTESELPKAAVVVYLNTEGLGYVAYAEGEQTPDADPEYPAQSAYLGLEAAGTYTFLAWPRAGSLFVKWTRDGEDFSTEPQITVMLDENAEYVAVFEEDPDWQNPVMNFIGEYQCDRAHATVECFGYDEAWITIDWGSSAWELTRWLISGPLDPDTLTITYEGSNKANLVFDDSGEIKSEETVYEDGTGTIAFHEDGTFTWHEDRSERSADMVFTWLGTDADPGTDIGSEQEQPSASGMFTGVMGTEFVIPEGFIQLDESPSIGYQYTFWHPDHEIRIVVYEIAPGSIPEGAYETDYGIAKRNPDVTYFNSGKNWFVQSGYQNNGEEIFYSKESTTDTGLKTLWISYPTAKRDFGDPIAADFEKNCRF